MQACAQVPGNCCLMILSPSSGDERLIEHLIFPVSDPNFFARHKEFLVMNWIVDACISPHQSSRVDDQP
jgi:hypothetical protein